MTSSTHVNLPIKKVLNVLDLGCTVTSLPAKNSDHLMHGDSISGFWPEDNTHYPGVINTLHRAGFVTILYDDGEGERLDIKHEIWLKESYLLDCNTGIVSSIATMKEEEP